MSDKLETATFGAGCFWCVEAVFQELGGVRQVVSGYSGGGVENPTYEQVCMGRTGHAEVVQITFDPEVISYQELLEVFWRIHDPTTLNRQGADAGTQYRSMIFYHSEEQRATAERSKSEAEGSKIWPDPIVTEISPMRGFFDAEEYHQRYYLRNPYQGYCSAVIDPKVRKFRKEFQGLLKSGGALSQG
jgi:peptide-methionine (S)-S-oxide reductase